MFLTKLMKAGVIDENNRQVLNEIELVEQGCSDFELECREVGGKWGLWLNIGVGQLLVSPIELVSSIYNDDWYFMDIISDDGQSSRCEVSIRKTSYSYEWSILNTAISLRRIMQFKYADYIEKIKRTIEELLQAYNSGGLPIAHAEPREEARMHQAIEMCHKQLQIDALHPSHYKLMTDKVCEEEFVFNILNDHEEHFEIGIGNRSYKTWISRWDFDLETIRHQVESPLHIYRHESNIELSFDTSNTTIRVKFVSVLDKIKDMGEGVGFEYKEYALVKILPNEFVNMPIIAGYCDRKQFVKTLYEGLLSLALQYPLESDGDEARFDAYAKIKSPPIERYIKDEEYGDYKKAQPRDSQVKDVIVMHPDYDSWGYSILRDRASFDVNPDGLIEDDEIYDKEGNPIVMPELYAWQQEIEPIIILSETGEAYIEGWDDYHQRGFAIAHKLRKVLSADFDLWYEAPFEDNSGTIPRKILII